MSNSTFTTKAPASTSVITYVLPGVSTHASQQASVIDANPTATTLAITCRPDAYLCLVAEQTITVGPWATITPAPGAPKTGTWDRRVTVDQDSFMNTVTAPYTEVEHCNMASRTVPTLCTVTNINIPQYMQGPLLLPTEVFSNPMDNPADWEPATVSYTVTEGLDKLQAATWTATASAKSAAVRGQGVDMGVLGLVGLVAAFLLR